MRFSPLFGLISSLVGFGFSTAAHSELPTLNATQGIGPLDAEITPEPGVGYFGSDIAVVGNIAMVGTPGAYGLQGRVGIFLRDSTGQWVRRGSLKANDRKELDSFGEHVAMAMGRRAIVASRTAVYVFALESGAWTQKQKLTFIAASRISDVDWQGDIAVVGVQTDNGADAAHVFDTRAPTFRHVAKLVAHDAQTADEFATRVAVYGNDVIATSPGYGNAQGAAYAFTCTTSACQERQKLIAIDGEAGDRFGSALDMQQDLLVIGAANSDVRYGDMGEPPSESNYAAGGAAYVFARNSGTWAESQKLRPTSTENGWYMSLGTEVVISGDRILVGAPYGQDYYDPGFVFVYRRQAGQPFVPSHVLSDWSSHGYAIGLYGTTAIVGIPDAAPWTGSAAVYALP